MPKLDQLQTALADLTPHERRQLASTIAYLDRDEGLALSRVERVVLDALFAAGRSRSPEGVWDRQVAFVREYGVRKFRERVDELLEFVEETRKFLRPIQVEGLVATCLRCLASELRADGRDTTPGTVLNNLDLLSHAIDRRFPGYIDAGHLHRIVGGEVREREPA